jgi:branched-chain amino acid transport system substrate-binding protein
MVGALGTPMNNAVLGEQLQKGVPNLMPFTAARSMAEPFHKLKFAAFSTYYDQVRSVTKHFVEKEGKKKVCVLYQDTDFGHEIRDGVRDQAKAMKLEMAAEASYGPADTGSLHHHQACRRAATSSSWARSSATIQLGRHGQEARLG